MAFATATNEKIIAYLGYECSAQSEAVVEAALTAIEALTSATAMETRIQGWLTELDTIQTAIVTQRGTEGSTILPELRREGRRFVELVANATGLEKKIDIFGTSGT